VSQARKALARAFVRPLRPPGDATGVWSGSGPEHRRRAVFLIAVFAVYPPSFKSAAKSGRAWAVGLSGSPQSDAMYSRHDKLRPRSPNTGR
jgi:hypothetical protein